MARRPEACLTSASSTESSLVTCLSASSSLEDNIYASPFSPQLPSEIWLKVFSYATWIPGVLTVSDTRALEAFTRDTYGITLCRRHRDMVDLKLSIGLVCRRWNELVSHLLFEYLIIRTGKQAELIADTLQRHSQYRQAGWGTKRVDLALEGVHIWTGNHSNALARIIRACPNLSVFSTVFCTADPESFCSDTLLDALSDLSQRSKLRRLELKGGGRLLNTMMSHLASSVEVLWLSPSRRCIPFLSPKPQLLPNLHAFILSFSYQSHFIQTWNMPALQTLVTEDSSLFSSSVRLHEMGTNLIRLRLRKLSTLVGILALCPNLEELTIDFDGFVLVSFDKLVPHTRLQHITMENCADFRRSHAWYQNKNYTFLHHTLRKNLFSVASKDKFPALEIVRLLLPLPHYDSDSCEHDFPIALEDVWTPWIDACRSQGIRVEASQGAEDQTADIWYPLTLSLLL